MAVEWNADYLQVYDWVLHSERLGDGQAVFDDVQGVLQWLLDGVAEWINAVSEAGG